MTYSKKILKDNIRSFLSNKKGIETKSIPTSKRGQKTRTMFKLISKKHRKERNPLGSKPHYSTLQRKEFLPSIPKHALVVDLP